MRWWTMWGVMWGVVWWRVVWVMSKSKWIEAMEPIVVSSSWSGNTQHLMFLMHPFGLTGHAEVKVWTHYTLEADSMNVLVTTVTHHTRMSRASLVWVLCFTCCLKKDKKI